MTNEDVIYELKYLLKRGVAPRLIIPLKTAIKTLETTNTESANLCKYGKWIIHNGYNNQQYYICSICKKQAPNWEVDYKEGAFQTNFCPHCGANMKGEK